jgi:hypothetical protein
MRAMQNYTRLDKKGLPTRIGTRQNFIGLLRPRVSKKANCNQDRFDRGLRTRVGT